MPDPNEEGKPVQPSTPGTGTSPTPPQPPPKELQATEARLADEAEEQPVIAQKAIPKNGRRRYIPIGRTIRTAESQRVTVTKGALVVENEATEESARKVTYYPGARLYEVLSSKGKTVGFLTENL